MPSEPTRSQQNKPLFSFTRKEGLIVGLLLFLALLIRILYLYFVKDHPFFLDPGPGAETFFHQADGWLQEWSYRQSPPHMPFYPLLIAFIKLLFPYPLGTLFALQSLIGLSCIVLSYILTRFIFNEHAGYLSILLLGFHPPWIVFETRPYPAVFLAFFLIAGTLFLVRSPQSNRSGRHLFLSGLFFALAFATQASVLILVTVVGLSLMVIMNESWTQRISTGFYFLTPSLVVLLILTLFHLQIPSSRKPTSPLSLQEKASLQLYITNRSDAPGYPDLYSGFEYDRLKQEPFRNKGIRSKTRYTRYFLGKTANEIWSHPLSFIHLLFKKGYFLITSYPVAHVVPLQTFLEESKLFGTIGPYEKNDRIWGTFPVPKILQNRVLQFPWIPFAVFIAGGIIGSIMMLVYGEGYAWIIPLIAGIPLVLLLVFAPSTKARLPVLPILSVLGAGGLYMVGLFLVSKEWLHSFWSVPLLFVLSYFSFARAFYVEKAMVSYQPERRKAEVLWRNNQPLEALDLLSKAHNKHFQNWDIRFAYAKYLWKLKQKFPAKYEQSRKNRKSGVRNPEIILRNLVKELQQADIPFGKPHGFLGNILLKQNSIKKARNHFQKAIKFQPDKQWWIGLGRTYLVQKNNEKNFNLLSLKMKKALQQFPSCLECKILKAFARVGTNKIKDPDQAFEKIKNEILKKKDDQSLLAKLYYYHARSLEDRRQFERAEELYRKSIDTNTKIGNRAKERLKTLRKNQ